MKICKDCEYVRLGYFCEHPDLMRAAIHPVWGESAVSCVAARGKDGACGLDAKFFTAKQVSWLDRLLCPTK